MRATRAVTAILAVAVALTTAVGFSVVAQSDDRIDLGLVGIEIDAPTVDAPAEEATDAADAESGAPSTAEGTPAIESPETATGIPAAPEVASSPAPVETVAPAPASPAPSENGNGNGSGQSGAPGRPESPGNSAEHNPNK